MTPVIPSGKNGASSAILVLTAVATAMALAPSASTTPRPAPGWLLRRDFTVRLSASSSTRATSPTVTSEPSVAALSTMPWNSSTVLSLVRAVMVALSIWSLTAGSAPSCPADTCAFCEFSAEMMSDGISANCSSLPGSIQMRMA
ncbi:hypothetical protein D3C72_1432210 [compost metagenome]